MEQGLKFYFYDSHEAVTHGLLAVEGSSKRDVVGNTSSSLWLP